MLTITDIITTYLFYLFILTIKAETLSIIEDIPIETYEALSHQEDDMDLEMLPRFQRSSQDPDDPKIHFYRYMKSLNGEFDRADQSDSDRFRNIPKPGGFRTIEDNQKRRFRRETPTTSTTVTPSSILSEVIEKHLGKPLELGILDTTTITTDKPENITEGFKRNAPKEKETTNTNSDVELNPEPTRPKREHKSEDHLEKLTLDNSREARGATKETWLKQPYQVRRSDESQYDDNAQASSENIRAPRVHFVTQRRLETGVPRTYEREARSKDFSRLDNGRDLPRDYDRDMDYYQPRYSRHYYPGPPANYYRDDPYHYRYDGPKDRYDSRYDNYYYDRERSYKPKRIIYYATLPDITRTPPNVDLRDRYNYGDRYDDRFNPYGDRYHTKLLPKSRYETLVRNKDQYPLKVSTDVNVKEIKKNPERRIYSEADRSRYGYQDRH